MSKRSEQREKVMKTLYQIEIYKSANLDDDINKLLEKSIQDEDDFFKSLLLGVMDNYDELTKEANKYLKNWRIERLDKTGASILRMALFELRGDTPKKVVINEALNLRAKRFARFFLND